MSGRGSPLFLSCLVLAACARQTNVRLGSPIVPVAPPIATAQDMRDPDLPEPSPVASANASGSDELEIGPDREDNKLTGPARASGEASEVDYASLPVMQEATLDPFEAEAQIHLGHTPRVATCPGRSTPMPYDSYGPVGWPGSAIVQFGDKLMLPILAQAGDGVLLDVADEVHDAPLLTDWLILGERPKKADSVRISSFEGTFDPSTITEPPNEARAIVRAVKKAQVTARALVPGLVYAFRRCVAGCGANALDSERREVVEMIGPPSVWEGTSGRQERVGSVGYERDLEFSDVSAAIAPGSSASVVIVATADAVAKFERPQPTSTDTGLRSITLDVVWPAKGAPEATLFMGTIQGKPDRVNALRSIDPICLDPEPINGPDI